MPVTVTTDWLREYAPNELSPEALAERLASLGLAVDEIEDLGGGAARLTLDVTANRGDCWSVLGIARELAAKLGVALAKPELSFRESGPPVDESFSVAVEDPKGCPRYTARLVRGVRLGPSPDWMQRRLSAVGIRPISNVVDVTNYVMCEMGHPLHAFDASLLRGRRVVVRRARRGERLALIDGSSKELSPEDIVIADAEAPVALAGVMGGSGTEIRDSTRDVLLESACFDPVSIRRTSRRHGISTESSVRFEHGVDPAGVELASRRAARLLAECAGGEVAPGVVDSNPSAWTPREIRLRHARIARLLGCEVPREEAARILAALGLELLHEEADAATWRVPSWRQDLSVEADLIEEIARIRGYDNLRGEATMRVFPVTPNPVFEARRRARDLLTGLGYTEICGVSFFSAEKAAFWCANGSGDSPIASAAAWPRGPQPPQAYRLRNPVRSREDTLRTSLIPSLLAAKLANQNRGRRRVRLFEAAPVCVTWKDEPDERLALLDDGAEGEDESPETLLRRAKGAVELLVERLAGHREVGFGPVEATRLAGLVLAYQVSAAGEVIGMAGLLDESAAKAWDVLTRPAVLELDLAALARLGGRVPQMRPLPDYPAIVRDVALVVDEGTTWAEVRSAAAEAAGRWCRPDEIGFLSVYRGRPVPEGRKSVAFRVIYRADDRTLTDEDVRPIHEEYVRSLCARLHAELRK